MSVLYVFGEHVQQLKAYLFISIKKYCLGKRSALSHRHRKAAIENVNTIKRRSKIVRNRMATNGNRKHFN